MIEQQALGVCYYPEQWPERMWAHDARRMAELGLRYVRIGEFAWSRIEPEPGRFDWGWLDRAIDTLAAAGLKVVLGTPTAAPPKWLVDRIPDMLALDAQGRPRMFGSRRHYCFSHEGYRRECARIVAAEVERYGRHDAVVAWQIDNEYGSDNTVRSYSPAALAAFRDWLRQRYGAIDALNERWGNVFWSMTYRGFDEIEFPNATPAETNPAHRLDFSRFSSDQVRSFNRVQADILRHGSPGRDVIHNFLRTFYQIDYFALGCDLDVVAWDSYPLAELEINGDTDERKKTYLRAGDPDLQGFAHDLYRGCGRGRMWVMEQQPGPVNWAAWNPAPRDGMVRLWTWEAFAHGAEVVSYFRWRQAPFAQEQMHSGLVRSDDVLDVGAREAATVAGEMRAVGLTRAETRADVAIVLDYSSTWMSQIQPQGRSYGALALVQAFYRALRKLGLSIDIVHPDSDLSAYKAVVVPSLLSVGPQAVARLAAAGGEVLLGPRAGSKTEDFRIPAELPPGPLKSLIPVTVTRVESLRPGIWAHLHGDFAFIRWREFVEPAAGVTVELRTNDGHPALLRHGRVSYLAGWPNPKLLEKVVADLVARAGIPAMPLPDGVRARRLDRLTFLFNYGPETRDVTSLIGSRRILLGSTTLPPSGVTAFVST